MLEQSDAVTKDDFATSYILRKQFREQKKETARLAQEAQAKGLGIALLPAAASDAAIAERVVFQRTDLTAAQLSAVRRKEIRTQSIFGGTAPVSSVTLKRKADLLALPLRPETPRPKPAAGPAPRVVPARPTGIFQS